MKAFEAAQFSKDYEYQAAKQADRKAERAKREQRRNPRGRNLTPLGSED